MKMFESIIDRIAHGAHLQNIFEMFFCFTCSHGLILLANETKQMNRGNNLHFLADLTEEKRFSC